MAFHVHKHSQISREIFKVNMISVYQQIYEKAKSQKLPQTRREKNIAINKPSSGNARI
jgi:hypothetical protein